MHLEGDQRTCASECSAGAGTVGLRSDRPARSYEPVRHSRDGCIASRRGNQHLLGLPLIGKTLRFCATGAGRAGARLDWLCGRWALDSQRLLVLQQKMLDTGVFCLVYLGLLNRRRPVHSRLNPKADFGNATVTGLQTPC